MIENIKTYYENRLPHIAPIGATFFVTFRLGDSLPQHVVKKIRGELLIRKRQLLKEQPKELEHLLAQEKKHYFKLMDSRLDQNPFGACYLKNSSVAQIVKDKLHEFDRKYYSLIAYCIMPNHVHVLFTTRVQVLDKQNCIRENYKKDYVQLYKIMNLIKGSTAYSANRYLQRKGKFWQKDSYDHFVRNGREFGNIVNYICQNPVKAKLVKEWEEFAHTFLRVPAP